MPSIRSSNSAGRCASTSARIDSSVLQQRRYVFVKPSAAARLPTARAAMADATVEASAPAAAIRFSSLKGILFDIDGTLTNSDPLHFKAFQQILAEKGFDGGKPISEEFFRHSISGRHNPEIASDLFPEWATEQQTQFSEDKEQRFRDMAASGEMQLLGGLPEFLSWVDSRGLRKAAVTNAPRANTVLMLKALKLDAYFEAVVLGEECVRAKPYPDPYLEGMRLLELLPGETMVVEDSPAGIKAAVAAGIAVIGLTTGQSREVLQAAGASVVCNDFADIMKLIEAAA